MRQRLTSRSLIVLLPILLLAACGGGADPGSGDSDPSGAPPDVEASGQSEPSSGGADAGPVDVCALLSEDDAIAVAQESDLAGDSHDIAIFSVDRTSEPDPAVTAPALGTCRFEFYYALPGDSGRNFSGTVVIQARSADNFDLYRSGTKVEGLGDEAYTETGSTIVRKGDVTLSAGENSMTDDYVVAMYRRMAPNLP
jgi:hypothetical protein